MKNITKLVFAGLSLSAFTTDASARDSWATLLAKQGAEQQAPAQQGVAPAQPVVQNPIPDPRTVAERLRAFQEARNQEQANADREALASSPRGRAFLATQEQLTAMRAANEERDNALAQENRRLARQVQQLQASIQRIMGQNAGQPEDLFVDQNEGGQNPGGFEEQAPDQQDQAPDQQDQAPDQQDQAPDQQDQQDQGGDDEDNGQGGQNIEINAELAQAIEDRIEDYYDEDGAWQNFDDFVGEFSNQNYQEFKAMLQQIPDLINVRAAETNAGIILGLLQAVEDDLDNQPEAFQNWVRGDQR